MSDQLELWVVYDHPKDWPFGWIARKWIGDAPTANTIITSSIHDMRAQLQSMGLVSIGRSHNDDPAITEVWV